MTKCADYIINFLADRGISPIFLVYGGAVGDLVDSFTRNAKTRYVCTMTEQAAGFAAEGYAKVTGKPGVAIATSGPGGQNLLTGIANCFYDSIPLIALVGQVKQEFLRPNDLVRQVGFQECDIVSMSTPVTKYAKMITEPHSIRYELEQAYWVATSGRPGPVLLDLPVDVQKAEVSHDSMLPFFSPPLPLNQTTAELPKIDLLIEDLEKAQRPVMLVGAGVRHAGAVDLFWEVSTQLGIPCFPTWNALDIVTSDHPYYGGRVGTFGGAGRNFAIQNSDLLLMIGTRLSGRITGSNLKSFAPGAKKYAVDIDAALMTPANQQIPFDVNINLDAKVFLDQLGKAVGERRGTRGERQSQATQTAQREWLIQTRLWRVEYDPVRPESFQQHTPVHPYAFIRELSRQMEPDDILVGDCGGNIVVLSHAFESKRGQRIFSNHGNSPMGFAMCAAMGAWFAKPKGRVVCVIGDGGFNMNIQELRTIRNYGVNISIFILNNGCYGITKMFQETNFEGRYEACGPKGYSPPDFRKIASAYGLVTTDIYFNADSRARIAQVLHRPYTVVCDVDCGDFHNYAPRIIGWDTPLDKMSPAIE